MKKPNFDVIVDLIGEKRYKHILRVEEMAKELAKCHSIDVDKAAMAALFHDICKYKDERLLWQEAERLEIKNLQEYQLYTQILHAYVAAEMAKKDYGIDDEDILNAIRYHTTGREAMSKLEKIVFLADYLEPMRDFIGVERLRLLAKHNLDAAMAASVAQNLKYLVNKKKRIHLDTVRCYNDYAGSRA